ncbi:tail fiber assembly protein [Pseudomonas sp. NPDC089534]|uniref:tail fiber assembly protein n=1 Tax=Pseudomonas sp. NPDC089534 TaxID=3364468 RepID=UPI0038176BB1
MPGSQISTAVSLNISRKEEKMIRYVYIEMINVMPFPKVLQVVDAEQMPDSPGVPGNWVEVSVDTPAQPGWKAQFTATGWVFSEPTYEDHVGIATNRMHQLLSSASGWLSVNPLQYKLDLGLATPDEEATLQAYKQYYINVCEVKNQSGYPYTINWPAAPF